MKLAIFVDYDNLLHPQKSSGILYVVRRALLQTTLPTTSALGICDVRIYGGWYEETAITALAEKLTVEVGREFPTIVRVPTQRGKVLALNTTATLAVAMLEEPRFHLFNTYRRKARARNVRVQTPAAVGCTNCGCPLPMTKQLIETGSCPNSLCDIVSRELLYRPEQKIVDTMLTCDMVYAPTQNYQQLILISGDDDFLPPLRTVVLRGTPVARFHPQPSRDRIPMKIPGKQFTDKDL